MTYNNIAKKYTQASHHTSKVRQIIMLYEGMIKFIMNAKVAINNKEIETRYNMIERTIKIVTALKAALDFNIGGNVSHVLSEFYDIMHKKLMNLHINHEIKACEEIIEMLSIMKKTWIEVEEGDATNTYISSNIQVSDLQISI